MRESMIKFAFKKDICNLNLSNGKIILKCTLQSASSEITYESISHSVVSSHGL